MERVMPPGHHGYQRACVLISGQASNGPNGSPGFACAGKTGPPSRFISEIAAVGEHFAVADRRHHGARDDWPDARTVIRRSHAGSCSTKLVMSADKPSM